jgi:CDP-glycerol glycerophosphotransferase (TagB/SpsB family)
MPYKKVYSSDAKYLAASDIMIGDMSDINYEYLVLNRPLILLANEWVMKEYPDIGIKCSLKTLDDAIKRSIDHPDEFADIRKEWLEKTHYKADGHSSKRILEIIINSSKIRNPYLVFLHANNEVLKNTVAPVYREAVNSNIKSRYLSYYKKNLHKPNNIYICANNSYLQFELGYKVHLDHGNKGVGITEMSYKTKQWVQNDYFKYTDIHLAPGKIGFNRTQKVIGPYKDRVILAGFPRSDDYLRLNTAKNRTEICNLLNIDPKKPLVIYAPAGIYQYPFKQGGSLNYKVLRELKRISKVNDYNIIVKLKSKNHHPYLLLLKQIKSLIERKFSSY